MPFDPYEDIPHLVSDWDDTNHFELTNPMHESGEYWWLTLEDFNNLFFHNKTDPEEFDFPCSLGAAKIGFVFDAAAMMSHTRPEDVKEWANRNGSKLIKFSPERIINAFIEHLWKNHADFKEVNNE